MDSKLWCPSQTQGDPGSSALEAYDTQSCKQSLGGTESGVCKYHKKGVAPEKDVQAPCPRSATPDKEPPPLLMCLNKVGLLLNVSAQRPQIKESRPSLIS